MAREKTIYIGRDEKAGGYVYMRGMYLHVRVYDPQTKNVVFSKPIGNALELYNKLDELLTEENARKVREHVLEILKERILACFNGNRELAKKLLPQILAIL